MESSSSSRPNREKMVKKVIWPAIRGRSCPICLKDLEAREAAVLTECKHAYCVGCIRKWSGLKRNCPLCNARFDSWFCDISLSSRTFYKERLSALNNNIADNARNDDVQVGFSRIGHRHRRWVILRFVYILLFVFRESVGKRRGIWLLNKRKKVVNLWISLSIVVVFFSLKFGLKLMLAE